MIQVSVPLETEYEVLSILEGRLIGHLFFLEAVIATLALLNFQKFGKANIGSAQTVFG